MQLQAMPRFHFSAIGTFHSPRSERYQQAHQGVLAHDLASLELNPKANYEQALFALEGFERVWLLFVFHLNLDRRTPPPVMVQPPRFDRKVGVFATRSPHRPNPIGITPARLIEVRGRKLILDQVDLLDRTPILDIKPYIPFCDAFPEAATGWRGQESFTYVVRFSDTATEQIATIAATTGLHLDHYAQVQLQLSPKDSSRKRIRRDQDQFHLDFRRWSLRYQVNEEQAEVLVCEVIEKPTF